jgi:hypothetical protein
MSGPLRATAAGTEHTEHTEDAQSLFGRGFRAALRLADLCEHASQPRPADFMRRPRLGSTARAHGRRPWAGPSGQLRRLPGECSCGLTHGRSCPRGLLSRGREAGRACDQGALALVMGNFSGRLDYESDALGSRLCLAENYNRATTAHHRVTERTEDTQRLFSRGFRAALRLVGPCGTTGNRARQPACGVLASGPRPALLATARGPGPSGLLRRFPGECSCGLPHGGAGTCGLAASGGLEDE